MSYRNTRRINKSVSPLGERHITPQNNSKYAAETMGQSNINSTINAPYPKQFTESGISNKYKYVNGREFRDDDIFNSSLAELNLELDNNMNQIIYLFGKRKTLTAAKKKKLKEEMEDKMQRMKYSNSRNTHFEFYEDEEFMKVVDFCQNSEVAIKMLSKIVGMLTHVRGSKAEEEDKSQSFWGKNRQLENQMDNMLEKLKNIDKNLEKQNKEVLEICKTLDQIEETLKSIAGVKGEDNIDKVEPLFNKKKSNYHSLNMKIKERENFKDSKIQYIQRICDALNHLKATRENRLNQIAQFFGLPSIWEFDKINFRDSGDFTKGFEELLRIKDKDAYTNSALKDVVQEIEQIQSEQDYIYNELLKKQSDEAKAYHNYSNLMNDKFKYSSILSLFTDEGASKIYNIGSNELSKKFGEYKNFLKRFLEEDSLIKQGLVKTSETLQTFVTLQKSIENEKERRHELLMILETYIQKKGDYTQKKEELRTLSIDEAKNQQKLSEYEEELQTILADGDIHSYKKVGNQIAACEMEKNKLALRKEKIDKEMEVMDREVVGMTSRIKEQYFDILSEIVPSDYEYELADGEDVRKLRNYLRKMYRRLGLLGNQ